MTGNFIYVFKKKDAEALLELGFTSIYQNETSNVYVFLNKEEQNFIHKDISFVLSNTLSF